MWALYVVSAGRGGITDGLVVLVGDGVVRVTIGEDGLERSPLEGRGVPSSRAGIRSKRPVGKMRIKARWPGLSANNVMESRRGKMRMSHSVQKRVDLEAGRRV